MSNLISIWLLSRKLKEDRWEVRKNAVVELGKIGNQRAIKIIINTYLADPSVDVMNAACDALINIGEPAVDLLIVTLIAEETYRSRWTKGAAVPLGKIGDVRAVEPLITALNEKPRPFRKEAAVALGRIGDPRAVEPLIVALRDDPRVSREAACALGKIGDPRAVEALINALRDKVDKVATAAAESLGEIGDDRAVEPLIASLDDERWHVRTAAASALGQIGDSRAVKPLIDRVKESNTRKVAIKALINLGWMPGGDENAVWYWIAKGEYEQAGRLGLVAVDPLLTELKNTDPHTSIAIAEALDNLGWCPEEDEYAAWYWIAKGEYERAGGLGFVAVEPLIAAFDSPNVKKDKARISKVLGEIGNDRAIEPLINSLGYRDGKTRRAAAEALDKLGWVPEKDKSAAYYWIAKDNIRKTCELGEIAVQPLINSLNYHDVWIIEALGQIGDVCAVEPLVNFIKVFCGKAPVYSLQVVAAAQALKQIGDPQAVDQLIGQLLNRGRGRNYPYNEDDLVAAALALGEIGDVRAVEPLITTFKDSVIRSDVFKAVCKAMKKIGEPAVEPLINLYVHGEKQVFVVSILSSIGDVRAVEPLISRLNRYYYDQLRRKVYITRNVASALGNLGDSRAVEPLIEIINGKYTMDWYYVAIALGQIGDSKSVEPLISALSDQQKCVPAAKALGQIGDPSAIEPLLIELKNPDSDNRLAAAEALDRLGWKPEKDENAAYYWIAKRNVWQTRDLGEIAVEPLLATFDYVQSGAIQKDAGEMLGYIGDSRANPKLYELLNHDNGFIRKVAETTIESIRKQNK